MILDYQYKGRNLPGRDVVWLAIETCYGDVASLVVGLDSKERTNLREMSEESEKERNLIDNFDNM